MRLPLLILHILGGSVGLLFGTIAMIARKGERLHRFSGNVFTIGMLTLASSGVVLGILKSQRSNVVGGVLTFYLIGSAWLAGRRRDRTDLLDWAGLTICIASIAGVLFLGVQAVRSGQTDNGSPPFMNFVFAGVLSLCAVGDVRVLARHGIAGRPRIVRHLWRMCIGLFIATGSFFLGQPQVFPEALRGTIFLIVPAVLPFPLLLYWLVRVRFKKAYVLRAAAPAPSATNGGTRLRTTT